MRDLGQLASRLREILPDGAGIAAVVPLTTGFSNETYRIEGPDLILRMPPLAGAMLDGHDVIAQARIYRALRALPGAPPVPEVVTIGVGGGTGPAGAPFFTMRRVAGDAIDDIAMQPWFVDGSAVLRGAVCRQWVATFAGIARLGCLDVLGPPVSPEDDARKWQAFARAAACAELDALFDRLLSRPAPRSGPPALVHGDTKLSNLMWHDGRVSAVLDWEMALNGEPLADLGYMLYSFESRHHAATRAQKLPGMLARDAVIALWESVSGRSAQGVEWHEIAQIGKIGAIIAEGCNMLATGRSSDPKLDLFRQNLGYYLSVMAAMLDSGGY